MAQARVQAGNAVTGRSRQTKAFLVGALLGAAAGAGYAVWNAPTSGQTLRRRISEGIENTIFGWMGMDQAIEANAVNAGRTISAATPASDGLNPATFPSSGADGSVAVSASEPSGSAGIDRLIAETAPAPAPVPAPTAASVPVDIVIDGPRPAPADLVR